MRRIESERERERERERAKALCGGSRHSWQRVSVLILSSTPSDLAILVPTVAVGFRLASLVQPSTQINSLRFGFVRRRNETNEERAIGAVIC